MCKNIGKAVKNSNVNVNNRRMNVNTFGKNGNCNCNLTPGLYDVDMEVCTPDAQELQEDMPQELTNYVKDGTPVN